MRYGTVGGTQAKAVTSQTPSPQSKRWRARKAISPPWSSKSDIETDNVQECLSRKQGLQEKIQKQEARLVELKRQRREQERKIPISELPEAERFDQSCNRSKHFIDTIKIIAYRAETALVHTLREKIPAHHKDEARSLARQIFQTEANPIPDPQAGTLTVEIHGLSTPRDDAALEQLCVELTTTETKYPGTDLRLIYRKVSRKVSR
ncbi:MAG: hypothetical protein HY735_23410 [Verrucomicrobia bacterium]|nr:hypothetical protein [Verrucomicrobiota bacterium]